MYKIPYKIVSIYCYDPCISYWQELRLCFFSLDLRVCVCVLVPWTQMCGDCNSGNAIVTLLFVVYDELQAGRAQQGNEGDQVCSARPLNMIR